MTVLGRHSSAWGMAKWCLTGGMLLMAAACARIPASPPAAALMHAEAEAPAAGQGDAFTAGSWPDDHWWEAYADPALNRLMAQVLSLNPDLAAARARLAAARAAVEGQRSRLLPRVSVGAALVQQRFSATGEHATLNGRSVLYGDFEPLQVTYDIDISGENGHRLAAAIGAARAIDVDRAAARLAVTAAVADAWFAAAGEQGALAADRRQLTLARRLLSVQRTRLAAGLDDAGPALAERQAVAQLRLQVAADRAGRDTWLAGLAALAGQPPAATASLRPLPPELGRFAVPDDLPIGLLRHRPDVMAALWQVEAARQAVKAARAAFYPHLNLALFAGWNSIHVSDLFDAASLAHSVGPSLSLPLFEGGALRAGLAGAQAGYDLAVSRYNARLLAAVKDVAAGLARWRADREAMVQSRSGAAAARDRARIRRVALRAGLSSALSSVSAELRAAEQEAAAAREGAAAARSWARLTTALGGGYTGDAQEGEGGAAEPAPSSGATHTVGQN